MLNYLLYWLLFVSLGSAALLPVYAKFLTKLKAHHPEIYRDLGNPTLFMASPAKGLRLQRFLFLESNAPTLHAEVRRVASRLRVLTPLFVGAVLTSFYYGYTASIRALF